MKGLMLIPALWVIVVIASMVSFGIHERRSHKYRPTCQQICAPHPGTPRSEDWHSTRVSCICDLTKTSVAVP
jgi:hypothetical protein